MSAVSMTFPPVNPPDHPHLPSLQVTLTILLLEQKLGGVQEIEVWLDQKFSKQQQLPASGSVEDFEHVKPE